MKYSIPQNLVLRICAYIQKDLQKEDYLSVGNESNNLLAAEDKEYVYKSMLLELTERSIVEGKCCPMHINEGLLPIMMTVRKYYHIGKGNIGFGSAFFANDPSVEDISVVIAQKEIGGLANLAKKYVKSSYVEALCEERILPIIVENSESISKDSYILLKDIRDHIQRADELEAFVIYPGKYIEPIHCRLAELSKEQREKLLK